MTVVIAIDPGMTGALAVFIDGQLVDVADMPVANKQVTAAVLAHDMRNCAQAGFDDRPTVIVEKVHAMPKQGVSSMFKFGRTLGIIEGVTASLGWPLRWVTPQEWKRHARLIGADKDAARLLALETWPDLADLFRLKKHVGRADAALIGRWAVTS